MLIVAVWQKEAIAFPHVILCNLSRDKFWCFKVGSFTLESVWLKVQVLQSVQVTVNLWDFLKHLSCVGTGLLKSNSPKQSVKLLISSQKLLDKLYSQLKLVVESFTVTHELPCIK